MALTCALDLTLPFEVISMFHPLGFTAVVHKQLRLPATGSFSGSTAWLCITKEGTHKAEQNLEAAPAVSGALEKLASAPSGAQKRCSKRAPSIGERATRKTYAWCCLCSKELGPGGRALTERVPGEEHPKGVKGIGFGHRFVSFFFGSDQDELA